MQLKGMGLQVMFIKCIPRIHSKLLWNKEINQTLYLAKESQKFQGRNQTSELFMKECTLVLTCKLKQIC